MKEKSKELVIQVEFSETYIDDCPAHKVRAWLITTKGKKELDLLGEWSFSEELLIETVAKAAKKALRRRVATFSVKFVVEDELHNKEALAKKLSKILGAEVVIVGKDVARKKVATKLVPIEVPPGNKCIAEERECVLFCYGTRHDYCNGWGGKLTVDSYEKHDACKRLG